MTAFSHWSDTSIVYHTFQKLSLGAKLITKSWPSEQLKPWVLSKVRGTNLTIYGQLNRTVCSNIIVLLEWIQNEIFVSIQTEKYFKATLDTVLPLNSSTTYRSINMSFLGPSFIIHTSALIACNHEITITTSDETESHKTESWDQANPWHLNTHRRDLLKLVHKKIWRSCAW